MPTCALRSALCALAGLCSVAVSGTEFSTTPVPADRVRDFVHGVVREAVSFREGSGTLMLVLSETGRYPEGEDAQSARLYATLFEETPDRELQERWRITDLVEQCPLDLSLRYTQPAFHLRDADRDGVLEVWVSYRLACRGDVSPTALKLIGYEGSRKLAIRGSSTLVYEIDGVPQTDSGAPPSVDAALAREPALRAEAERIWQSIARESLSE
ncbi:MAG: hypothetical protein MUE46_13105 [Xanthomonadales bacterium]|nr:hypothetical protein [Xanthomonadales bacterium]